MTEKIETETPKEVKPPRIASDNRYALAGWIVGGSFLTMWGAMFMVALNVKIGAEPVLLLIINIVSAIFGGLIGFFFGSQKKKEGED